MIGYSVSAYPPVPQSREKFSVRRYLDRIEAVALEIAEDKEPIDKTIILWWGLDGLLLDEDGTLKWLNRKKMKPVHDAFCQTISPTVFYADNAPYLSVHQQCESFQTQILRQQTQCNQSQIDALRVQLAKQMQNTCCINQMIW